MPDTVWQMTENSCLRDANEVSGVAAILEALEDNGYGEPRGIREVK